MDSVELEAFRDAQRRARECMHAVAGALAPGLTEREVAAQLTESAREAGANAIFHSPLVWFGDRTVLPDGASNRENGS